MNAFTNSVRTSANKTRTTNGMTAYHSTGEAVLDLFSSAGAMRGQDILPKFKAAYKANPDLALRVALWLRDAREGAGERALFRNILGWLTENHLEDAKRVLARTPELGRWDDVLTVADSTLWPLAVEMIRSALKNGNGLAAKWMPRKGPVAAKLRAALGMSPRQYRKTLVALTSVVETQMCAGDWEKINFEHVPSVAGARYKKAFNRHVPQAFTKYAAAAVKGEAKVNASAVFPHTVLQTVFNQYYNVSAAERNFVVAQWNALPNYMDKQNVLPMVDVSGSMSCPAGGSGSVTCLQVAVSLGLYTADKNKGVFKDMFLTFSTESKLTALRGSDIVEKAMNLSRAEWDMSTDLVRGFEAILNHAVRHKVPQSDMPTMLLIMSDMQFNAYIRTGGDALQAMKARFKAAGYEAPAVVFWNLNDYGTKPVTMDTSGVALVSGFSPTILKSVLSADMDDFTPLGIMMKTIMVDRYAV